MEVKIYTVKAKGPASNKWVKDIKWQNKKAKAERKSTRDLKNLYILLEKSAQGLGSRRECC